MLSDYVQRMSARHYVQHLSYTTTKGLVKATGVRPRLPVDQRPGAAEISMRNYGLSILSTGCRWDGGSKSVLDPVLRNVTNLHYRSFDLEITGRGTSGDVSAICVFESSGEMPRLIVMRLPIPYLPDSTREATHCHWLLTTTLGTIVEGISHSRFWPSTAIFVLEDDAQEQQHRLAPLACIRHFAVCTTAMPWTVCTRQLCEPWCWAYNPMTPFSTLVRVLCTQRFN